MGEFPSGFRQTVILPVFIICERSGEGWRPWRNRLRGKIYSTARKPAPLHYTSTNPLLDACLREMLRFDAGRQFDLRSAMNG